MGERVVPQKAIIVLLTVLPRAFQNGGEMEDKILMSHRALPKATSQGYILSQRYIPNRVTLEKRNRLHSMTGASLRWAPVKSVRTLLILSDAE